MNVPQVGSDKSREEQGMKNMVQPEPTENAAQARHTEAEPSASVQHGPVWMAAVAYTQGEKWFIGLMGCRARNRFEAEGWLQQKCRDLGRKVEQITVNTEPMEYAEPRNEAATPAQLGPGMDQ